MSGRFRPGERLREQHIAKESGVSRTPVREALGWLEHEGVVQSEANRGSQVAPLTVERIAKMYELRARLEGFAAAMAARRITDEQRARLSAAAAEFTTIAGGVNRSDGPDIERLKAANETLHLVIAEAADNPFLASSLSTVQDNPLVALTYRSFSKEELARSALFHELIVEAICTGQVERAERMMIEHVLQARDAIVQAGQFDDNA